MPKSTKSSDRQAFFVTIGHLIDWIAGNPADATFFGDVWELSELLAMQAKKLGYQRVPLSLVDDSDSRSTDFFVDWTYPLGGPPEARKVGPTAHQWSDEDRNSLLKCLREWRVRETPETNISPAIQTPSGPTPWVSAKWIDDNTSITAATVRAAISKGAPIRKKKPQQAETLYNLEDIESHYGRVVKSNSMLPAAPQRT